MKLNKLFAAALAVMTLSACDHDTAEDYPTLLGGVNTAKDVTVSLPTQFTAKESEMPFQLPITVTGETNGKVVVKLQTKQITDIPAGLEPAKEVEHFNITSYTINIPEGDSEGYVEIYPVWEAGVINNDRVVEVSIVSVQGATIGNADCQLTITNVDDPFTGMYGKWKFTSKKCSSSVANEYTLTMSGPNPDDEEYYGKELYAYGLRGLNYIFLPLNFDYNKETGEKTLSIQVGTIATDGLINFSGIGTCVVAGVNYDAPDGDFGEDIPMTYTLDESGLETIAMTDMNNGWVLAVMPYPALNEIAGYWGTWLGITLSRQN